MVERTIPDGREWFSDSWGNGEKRSLNEGDHDPFDSKVSYSCGQPNVPFTIDGNTHGRIRDATTSVRLFVEGPWLNTEMTAYLRIEENPIATTDMQLRSRSDHEIKCAFGDYLVKWDRKANIVCVEVEAFHPIYKRGLNKKPFTDGLPTFKWLGFKTLTRNCDNNTKVKVEGFTNYSLSRSKQTPAHWKKMTDFTFDGHNIEGPIGVDTPEVKQECGKTDEQTLSDCLHLNAAKWCWIRLNNVKKARFKYFSVREISPLP